jgi:hypothetical protein
MKVKGMGSRGWLGEGCDGYTAKRGTNRPSWVLDWRVQHRNEKKERNKKNKIK